MTIGWRSGDFTWKWYVPNFRASWGDKYVGLVCHRTDRWCADDDQHGSRLGLWPNRVRTFLLANFTECSEYFPKTRFTVDLDQSKWASFFRRSLNQLYFLWSAATSSLLGYVNQTQHPWNHEAKDRSRYDPFLKSTCVTWCMLEVLISRPPADDRSAEACVIESSKDTTDISGHYPGLPYHCRKGEGNEATLPTTRKTRRVPTGVEAALECWWGSCVVSSVAPLPTASHRPRFFVEG